MMSERPKRKGIPLYVKLQSALYALGLDPGSVDWHHTPSLGMRPLNDEGTDTVPRQLDPKHIVPMAREAHRERTPADVKAIARTKRLERKHKEFWDKLAPTLPVYVALGNAMIRGKAKRKLPSRPFPKGRKFNQRSKV